MVAYMLEQSWEILRHYFENHGNIVECVGKLHTDFGSFVCSLSSEKSELNWHLIDKLKYEKPKTVRTIENILLWQKVCVKCHQHQFTPVLNNWTFHRHHWDEFYIKTLVGRHTKFNWFRSWSQLTIKWVFASLSGVAIDL